MNDVLMDILDVGMLVVPVGLILLPWLFVVLMKGESCTADLQEAVEVGQRKLLGWTLFSLCVWFVFLWIYRSSGGSRGYLPIAIAQFCFFPMWFFLAIPLVRLKRPSLVGPYDRGGQYIGPASEGPAYSGATVRTASLVNREKQSPIKPWMLAVGGFLVALPFIAVLGRGFAPFPLSDLAPPTEVSSSATTVKDDAASTASFEQLGYSQRTAWYRSLVSLGVMLPMVVALAWICSRRSMSEAEPIPQGWNDKTAAAYAKLRKQRAAGLFWGLIGLGVLVGTAQAFIQWLPNSGPMLGVVFGTIGGLTGLLGGAWGMWVSFQRAAVNESMEESQGSGV